MKNIKSGLIKIGKYEFEIPEYRFELLYFSTDQPRNINQGSFSISLNMSEEGTEFEIPEKDEPSTIFLQFDIEKPKSKDNIGELGYFPNYARMNKKQRWTYLNWLQDIRKTINIGFVFTYYYGLERKLETEAFEEAFYEINLLRKYHDNHSFKNYSLHTLIQKAIKNKREELLNEIYYQTNSRYIKDDILFLKYVTGKDIDPDYFVKIVTSISGTNLRYIKKDIDLYLKILVKNFNKEYGMSEFPFSNIFDTKEINKIKFSCKANYNMERDPSKCLKYPHFMSYKPFLNEVLRIHMKTHEDVKVELANLRKQN